MQSNEAEATHSWDLLVELLRSAHILAETGCRPACWRQQCPCSCLIVWGHVLHMLFATKGYVHCAGTVQSQAFADLVCAFCTVEILQLVAVGYRLGRIRCGQGKAAKVTGWDWLTILQSTIPPSARTFTLRWAQGSCSCTDMDS